MQEFAQQRKEAYQDFAITKEERNALPVGTHYYKAIFDDAEGLKDTIGYYKTFKEAIKACKGFAKVELEYFYAEEFDIYEYEATKDEDGTFRGKLKVKYTNDPAFKFAPYQFIEELPE